MHKYKLTISYNGNYINGWSGQNHNLFFIKENILKILYKFTKVIELQCASRTDSGVHAIRNVLHLSLLEYVHPANIMGALNSYLPTFIRINNIQIVDNNFHARFSAISREYIYKITNKNNALLYHLAYYHNINAFNIDNASIVLQGLLQKQNFMFFKNKHTIVTKAKTMEDIFIQEIKEIENMIIITFRAKSFFHHQIRNIMGSILKILLNKWSIEDFWKRFDTGDRRYAGEMAAPYGLYLNNIIY